MCGIVGVVAERNAVPILMEGLRRLEYRGYDSAGLAVLTAERQLARLRAVGKVSSSRRRWRRPHRGACGHRAYPVGYARRTDHARMPIRTSRATASPSCTTASSRTMRHCARASSIWATPSVRRPTPRSSPTAFTIIWRTRPNLFEAVRKTVAELHGAYALAVVARVGSRMHRARARGLPGRHRARHR